MGKIRTLTRFTKQEKSNIIKLYKQGTRLCELSELYHRDHKTIAYVLYSNGQKRRPKKGYAKRKKFLKYYYNENIFDIIDTEEKAYWLGFLIGDGSIDRNRLRIELANKDINHLYKFQKFMKTNTPVAKTAKNCSYICITNAHIAKTLIKYSIVPNKTYKKINADNIPKSLLRHYYRGFLDADGCVGNSKTRKNSYQFSFVCRCYQFLRSLNNWVSKKANIKLGGLYKNYKDNNYCHSTLVLFGLSRFAKIYNLFYKDATIYLDRKKEKADLFMSEISTNPLS